MIEYFCPPRTISNPVCVPAPMRNSRLSTMYSMRDINNSSSYGFVRKLSAPHSMPWMMSAEPACSPLCAAVTG
ncbi:MAG: hypothetical protein LC754_05055 [Acidobacteria bacterium]|nr:hypothetical protein [Acidobacteriota bacterium]